MLTIEHFSFFSAVLTLFAFIHLYWPGAVKQVVDRLAREIGTDQFMTGYDEQYYYAVGRIYGIGALIMSAAAVTGMAIQG